MTATTEYKEHITYTFHAFCKVVIRNASISSWRDRSRNIKGKSPSAFFAFIFGVLKNRPYYAVQRG